jgi:hypothetical protein
MLTQELDIFITDHLAASLQMLRKTAEQKRLSDDNDTKYVGRMLMTLAELMQPPEPEFEIETSDTVGQNDKQKGLSRWKTVLTRNSGLHFRRDSDSSSCSTSD